MSLALSLDGVFQHVTGRLAIQGLSLDLPEGEWLLICGPNGAGKTLLSRLVLGLDRPSAGRVQVLGRDLAQLDGRGLARLRREVGAVLQRGSLLADYSVLANILLPLRQTPLTRGEMARAARLVMTLLGLDGLENHPPQALSLGQQRRVELARALIRRPRLLVWDGLSDGLDPTVAREILAVLDSLRGGQPMALIATDNTPDALGDIPARVGVLNRGRLLFQGTPAALAAASTGDLELRTALGGRL
ncbi:MAG: ATP-binding cassette domain-containing protein [Gammaproteobacteria bacterium]|nr:ATP-binding cassette domain-containing protein [Candidatus Thioaporhodococcus sediminis]TNF53280.1 MAG: ATP-binding cassette domain-containing protein [Gammaproteobacteria bacterium]